MPFTPYHIGPALGISLWDYKKKRIDIAAAILGSIIIDVRAMYIWFFSSGNFHDGPFHTFLGAIILGVLTGCLVHLFRNPLQKVLEFFHWQQDTTLLNKILTASSMAILHIILDSFLYTDIRPFWPFSLTNPFLGIFSTDQIQIFCIIGYFVGIAEYIGFWIWKYSNPKMELDKQEKNHESYYSQFATKEETME